MGQEYEHLGAEERGVIFAMKLDTGVICMKKMRLHVANWSILIGTTLTACNSATPAHAQKHIVKSSDASGETEMHDNVTKAQREAILALLDEVMAVLRDNKLLDLNNGVFGRIRDTRRSPANPGASWSFEVDALPSAVVRFTTSADPLDYSEDRMNVPVVPTAFEILLTGSLVDVSRPLLEKRLDLADYWIGRETGERKGNDIGPLPEPQQRIHGYRYRAKEHLNTRVPVNVNLDYADPDASDPAGSPKLLHVSIKRAYPYLTPEMRRQKREEKEQRVRELYGNPGATK